MVDSDKHQALSGGTFHFIQEALAADARKI